MIIEFGNPNAVGAVDDAPHVTTLHFPEADETGAGGYSLEAGQDVKAFKDHVNDANSYNNGIFHLPEQEILLSVTEGWKAVSKGRPSWVEVTPVPGLTPEWQKDELERFLSEFYEIPIGKPEDVEFTHHTRFGVPGSVGPVVSPSVTVVQDIQALFTNDGRAQQSLNYGGGQVGAVGTGTAATTTTFTTNLTLVTNAWAGYRIYAYNGTAIVWGNIISNTNAASASVVTIDRWYNAATPGGAAATTPSSGYYFMLADGGNVSSWFVGLSASNSPAATDHAIANNITNEITTAGGGLIRKIAPYAIVQNTSPMSFTLIPVFTANGSDSLPVTVASAGAFSSMVNANVTQVMKFETALSSTATFSASGDSATLTWTISGS